MKTKLLTTLALTLGVSMLTACAGAVQFSDRATDPNVSLWQEPETDAPSDPQALIGIWHAKGSTSVFRFEAGGVLTAWGLTTGYDYEYSNMATGTYTYDGVTLTMTIADETVQYACRVQDGSMTLEDSLTMTLRTDEPTKHPTYSYPDFEQLAANLPLPNAALLTGQTISVSGKRLQAQVELKQTYFSGKTMEKLTTGIAKLGDMVNIDYTGKLNGEAFSGGTAKGADVTVAPDTGYIPGFSEGIAGHSVGETFDVTVTFPENYGSAELAGKQAVFTMTLNAIYNTTLTDEMVAAYEKNTYQTVAEWEQSLYQNLIEEAVWSLFSVFDMVQDESSAYLYFYQNMLDYYHYYASYYSMEFEQFLAKYVGMTVEDLEADAHDRARELLLAALTARTLSLTPDDTWLATFTKDYLSSYIQSGYTQEAAEALIAEGDGKNQFRAAMLSKLVAGYLYTNNTFIDA